VSGPLRVGLVGGRRARQGLGPFVARDLRAAGADVQAFVATSEATCAEATEQLARSAGVRPRPYLEVAAMLEAEPLDALAICSPHEAHAGTLELALDRGLHALCEKPLVWGKNAPERCARLTQAFANAGLVLFENCQWPYALPAFARLHPGVLDRPPRRFGMLLEPAGHGADMLGDSLPHPLSLLQQLAPADAPRLEAIRCDTSSPDAHRLHLRFSYVADDVAVESEVELHRKLTHPRENRLVVDGHAARRRVAPDYALAFEDAGRSVQLDDPLTALVADFVARAREGVDPEAERRTRGIAARAALLERLVSAWRLQTEAA